VVRINRQPARLALAAGWASIPSLQWLLTTIHPALATPIMASQGRMSLFLGSAATVRIAKKGRSS